MWNLALKNTKEIWRDKKLLIISLFFPIFLLLLTHLFFKEARSYLEAIPVAVVNPETNFPKAGKLLVMALEKTKSRETGNPLFKISAMSKEDALRNLHAGKVVAALLVPEGFTEAIRGKSQGKLVLLINERERRGAFVASVLYSLVDRFGTLVEKSQGNGVKSPVLLSVVSTDSGVAEPELDSFIDVLIFALIFLIPYAAGQWVSEFEHGSFARFRLANFSPAALFGGTLFSTAFLGFLQGGLLLVVGILLGLRLYSLLFWIWPIAFCLVLASGGVGLILSTFIEKEKQLNLFASLLLIPLFFLSSSAGRELGSERVLSYLPWHQGYSLLSDLLTAQTPEMFLFVRLIVSSLILAFFGMSLFSMRRLYYG